jgi:uncharacterized RDD family membrane protein YckC
MSEGQMPAGWYYAEGDPPGTQRYWNGEIWTGEPQLVPGAPGTGFGSQAGQSNLASPGKRIGGRLIDVIITLILSFILTAIVGGGQDNDAFAQSVEDGNIDFELLVPGAATLIVGALFAFLWDFAWTAFAAGTPGKLIVGARVAEASNMQSPPSTAAAAKRALHRLLGILGIAGFALWSLSGLAGFAIGVVSLIFLFTDDSHRTVMDRIGGTVVINK